MREAPCDRQPVESSGTAAYDVTVAPARDSGFSACYGLYVDGEGRVEVLAWVRANVAIAAIRHELYVNGELNGVSNHPGLLAGQTTRFGGAWGGPDTDPDIECSHVINAQPIVTQLDQGGDGWPNGPAKLAESLGGASIWPVEPAEYQAHAGCGHPPAQQRPFSRRAFRSSSS